MSVIFKVPFDRLIYPAISVRVIVRLVPLALLTTLIVILAFVFIVAVAPRVTVLSYTVSVYVVPAAVHAFMAVAKSV